VTRESEIARDVWATMRDLVVNNERKHQVSDETGLSFGKTKALRRIAQRPLSMGELATLLGMDPPNVTTLVDDLERAGLVRREPHDTDRRVLLVLVTPTGARVARRTEAILSTPPAGLSQLPATDLEHLQRILQHLT